MTKRAREAKADLSTLAVYTYQGSLATHHVPLSHLDLAMPALLTAIFGSRARHSVFSITASSEGFFLVLDESLHRELFGGSGAAPWSCIYIHESSTERSGHEISGSLSTLCDCLAAARVPVLNVCTLARNFMLVRSSAAEVALQTLRSAVERHSATDAGGADATGIASSAVNHTAGVNLTLLRPTIAIATLSVDDVKACAHGLLLLLLLQRRGRAAKFMHYFEMAGEVSLIVEESALDALQQEEPNSAAKLLEVLKPSLVGGWRVIDVTAPAGSDGVGILSSVCLPLASLPLMNCSTLGHSFVLLRDVHVNKALERLSAHFDVATEATE